MKKFVCQKCGACCANFGSFGTLPLFFYEKENFEKQAKKLGIKIQFIGENFLLDRISGDAICLNWGMKGNPCPFLDKENECKIYENRGLICKAFPIEKIPEKNQYAKLGCFMHCPKNDLKDFVHKDNLVKEKNNTLFKRVFGEECVLARNEIEKRKIFIGDSLKKLKEEKKADFIEVEFLDFSKIKVLDIFEFLERFNLYLI